ncbi:carotenoid oxygenase [Hortaea werneckii]|nr:carotenoid oxygenase [Hortaea werneckii]
MEPPNRIPNPLRQLRILQQTIRAGSIKRRHTHIHTPKRKNPPQPLRPKELPRPRPDGLEGVQREQLPQKPPAQHTPQTLKVLEQNILVPSSRKVWWKRRGKEQTAAAAGEGVFFEDGDRVAGMCEAGGGRGPAYAGADYEGGWAIGFGVGHCNVGREGWWCGRLVGLDIGGFFLGLVLSPRIESDGLKSSQKYVHQKMKINEAAPNNLKFLNWAGNILTTHPRHIPHILYTTTASTPALAPLTSIPSPPLHTPIPTSHSLPPLLPGPTSALHATQTLFHLGTPTPSSTPVQSAYNSQPQPSSAPSPEPVTPQPHPSTYYKTQTPSLTTSPSTSLISSGKTPGPGNGKTCRQRGGGKVAAWLGRSDGVEGEVARNVGVLQRDAHVVAGCHEAFSLGFGGRFAEGGWERVVVEHELDAESRSGSDLMGPVGLEGAVDGEEEEGEEGVVGKVLHGEEGGGAAVLVRAADDFAFVGFHVAAVGEVEEVVGDAAEAVEDYEIDAILSSSYVLAGSRSALTRSAGLGSAGTLGKWIGKVFRIATALSNATRPKTIRQLLPAGLGALLNNPRAALQGKRVHNPKVHCRHYDRQNGVRQGEAHEELVGQTPQHKQEGRGPHQDQTQISLRTFGANVVDALLGRQTEERLASEFDILPFLPVFARFSRYSKHGVGWVGPDVSPDQVGVPWDGAEDGDGDEEGEFVEIEAGGEGEVDGWGRVVSRYGGIDGSENWAWNDQSDMQPGEVHRYGSLHHHHLHKRIVVTHSGYQYLKHLQPVFDVIDYHRAATTIMSTRRSSQHPNQPARIGQWLREELGRNCLAVDVISGRAIEILVFAWKAAFCASWGRRLAWLSPNHVFRRRPTLNVAYLFSMKSRLPCLPSYRRLYEVIMFEPVAPSTGKRKRTTSQTIGLTPQPRHPYLTGNFAPIHQTLQLTPCTHAGTIPKELANGEYVRNGSNPVSNEDLGRDAHWFDGDGMLSGVSFPENPETGEIVPEFVNQYVLTDLYLSAVSSPRLRVPILPSIATLDSTDRDLGHPFFSTREQATDQEDQRSEYAHSLSRWQSAGDVRVRTADADTTARARNGGMVQWRLCRERKKWRRRRSTRILPQQGSPTKISEDPEKAALQERTRTTQKKMLNRAVSGVSGAKMMHDFGVSRTHTIIMDLPLSLDPMNQLKGLPPVAYDSSKPSRFGIFPRWNPENVTWFETDACCIFHTANTWDSHSPTGAVSGVNMLACRLTSATLVFAAGNIAPPTERKAQTTTTVETKRSKRMPFFSKYDPDSEASLYDRASQLENPTTTADETEAFLHLGRRQDPLDGDELDDYIWDEEQCRLYYYHFNQQTHQIDHQWALATIPFEFPSVRPDREMHAARYVYGCSTSTTNFGSALGKATKIDVLVKMDARTLIERGVRNPPRSVTGAVDTRTMAQEGKNKKTKPSKPSASPTAGSRRNPASSLPPPPPQNPQTTKITATSSSTPSTKAPPNSTPSQVPALRTPTPKDERNPNSGF